MQSDYAAASQQAPAQQEARKPMTVLKSLVVYWNKDGGDDKFLVPPLEDIIESKNHPLLEPYPAYVNLMGGNLGRGPDGTALIRVPREISHPLFAGTGRALQRWGIKVVLSILPHSPGKGKENEGVGWSTLTAKDNESLVSSIRAIKNEYNIDGIDIDDEFGPWYTPNGPGTAQNFYNTVSAIREAFGWDFVISNVVYLGSPYGDLEKYTKFPDLGHLMTHCATMTYGSDHKVITDEVQTFADTGKIPLWRLYAGVQPGPVDSKGHVCAELTPGEKQRPEPNWTSITAAEEVAGWAKTNCAGVMIYSYSTDTVDYAGDQSAAQPCPRPPNPTKSGWPNKDDHAWQKAITKVLNG
jgi:hypothetical protein